MDKKQQNRSFLKHYLNSRNGVPWPGVQGGWWKISEACVRQALHELGGMAGHWDAPHECFYYTAQA